MCNAWIASISYHSDPCKRNASDKVTECRSHPVFRRQFEIHPSSTGEICIPNKSILSKQALMCYSCKYSANLHVLFSLFQHSTPLVRADTGGLPLPFLRNKWRVTERHWLSRLTISLHRNISIRKHERLFTTGAASVTRLHSILGLLAECCLLSPSIRYAENKLNYRLSVHQYSCVILMQCMFWNVR